MSQNDFLPFAGDGDANTASQAEYLAATTLRGKGFQSGVAPSKFFNKVWRQSSLIAAAVATFIANTTGANVLDNGDVDSLAALLGNAVATRPVDGNTRGAAHLWHVLRSNQRDAYLMVTGDSTGNATDEWVYLTAQWLASKCPTHTVKYRLWGNGDGSSQTWGAYTTLQTGTGPAAPFTGSPFTIYIDNASVSGSNTFYSQAGREAAIWTGNPYDVVIGNFGHNLGTAMTEDIALPEWVAALAHWRMMAPDAALFVTLQNPRQSGGNNINTNGSAQTKRMVAAWIKAIALYGAGVIDVWSAFEAVPDQSIYMADETHPNALGQSQLWLPAVQSALAEPLKLTGLAPSWVDPMSMQMPNYVSNPRFSRWVGATPVGWSFNSCTVLKNSAVTEGSLYSAQVVVGAGTNPYMIQDLTPMLPRLRGKFVTLAVRLWKPSGLDLLAGRVAVESTNNIDNPNGTSYPRGTACQDGWELAVAQLNVPRNATALKVRIYTGKADGSDVGKVLYVSSVGLFEGMLPGAVGADDLYLQQLLDFYSAGNVGPVLPNNPGTTVATGTTITLTGGSALSGGADTYINLPGVMPGQKFKVTFNPVSAAGNTAGGCLVRKGLNGGVDTITPDSGTGDWSIGGGVVSFVFTAPADGTPVCLRPFGYTGTTGYVLNQWSVTPLASGIAGPVSVPMSAVRNSDGTALSATPSALGFKISQAPTTNVFLLSEDVLNTTKVLTTTVEITLPSDYIAGRDLTVITNVYHQGTGTAGPTKTLALSARLASDTTGLLGSNLCGATASYSNTAADYTFIVAGATLTPGCRVLLQISMTLTETGNVNPINARINSIRYA